MAGETNTEAGAQQPVSLEQSVVTTTEVLAEQKSMDDVEHQKQEEFVVQDDLPNEPVEKVLEVEEVFEKPNAVNQISEEPSTVALSEVSVKEEPLNDATVLPEPREVAVNESNVMMEETNNENDKSSLVNGEAEHAEPFDSEPKERSLLNGEAEHAELSDSELNGTVEAAEPAVSEKSSTAPAAPSSSPTDLPKFLYNAMEKVATEQGFTVGNYKIEFDVGSNKGDGFVGQMFKAYLTEGDRREVYLCKIPPLSEARRKQFQSMPIFSRETLAYKHFLPLIISYQQEKGISREDGFFNVPKCYYAECDEAKEESVIVMEDLRLQDYRMWDKMVPVNYEHARLTMQQLGRLHAVSLAMKRDRPAEFEPLKVPDLMHVMMPPGSPLEAMLVKMLSDAKETLEAHETKERTKMQKLIENMRQEMTACTDGALAEPYAVLGHGDCWVNNYMFHYKNGAPERVVMLDWQITRYVSPVTDLAYFIFCCTDEEFRRRHYDEMMNIYYNSLATLLEKLGHNPQEVFPRTALMRQLRRFGRFGVLMAMFLVPMLCTRNEDLPDMDEAAEKYRETKEMNVNDITMNANQNAYRSRMSSVIRDMVRYGYL